MSMKLKGKRQFVYIDPKSKVALKYMAYTMGVSMQELLRHAVLEFADRRLPRGWEEVSREDEDYRQESTRHSKAAKRVRAREGSGKVAPEDQVGGGAD